MSYLEAGALGIQARALPHLEQMLGDLGEPEGYYIFRYQSHAVHTTNMTLELARRYKEDGTVLYDFGDDPLKRCYEVGINLAQTFMKGYLSAARLLEWETVPEIEAFDQHIAEKLDQLRVAAPNVNLFPRNSSSLSVFPFGV